MPELEIIEILELLFMIIGIFLFIFNLKKNKDLLIWLPGFISLTLGFLFTNLEAIAEPELFNFLEHFFYMLTGILFFLVIIIKLFSKRKNINLELQDKT